MSSPFAPAPSRSKLTARQQELFQELVTLYLDQGFSHLTLEETATVLKCSKSTIYALAASREQLVKAVVVAFFRGVAERVDAAVARESDPLRRIEVYLMAVSAELEPASAAFMDDIAAFAPARETYELNTQLAAAKVRELISEGVAGETFREVPASFIADVVSSEMVRIQQREVARTTGLKDADAYRELAHLIVNGIRSNPA